jgi:hypothetical protein
VAVAYNGTVAATSLDGVNWTARTLPTSAEWAAVTYGNGVFVAVTHSSAAATLILDQSTDEKYALLLNSIIKFVGFQKNTPNLYMRIQ